MIRRLAAILTVPLLSVTLVPTVACQALCWDPDPDCKRYGGHIDDECKCVGQHYPGGGLPGPTHPPPPPPPPPPAMTCSSDGGCVSGHCVDHICVARCTTDGDCHAGSACDDGTCTTICSNDTDCPDAFACAADERCRFVVVTCSADAPCTGDRMCLGGQCVAHCGDTPCPTGTTCVDGNRCETPHARSCAADSDCHAELEASCVAGKCVSGR